MVKRSIAITGTAALLGSLLAGAARLHHRMVAIRPFPNGNGRHARLVADTLRVALGSTVFSWGRRALTRGVEASEISLNPAQVAQAEGVRRLQDGRQSLQGRAESSPKGLPIADLQIADRLARLSSQGLTS